MELYRDLALARETPAVAEAVRYELRHYDLKSRVTDLGPDAVGQLLGFIEEFGFGEHFYERGTPEFKKHGEWTVESRLATSAVFLLGEMPLEDKDIARLQSILTRRVELDRGMERTSTLGENIARMLHTLRPRRFPKSQLNPKTNHLDNPEPFLP